MRENSIEEAVERLEKSIDDVWFNTLYGQEEKDKDLKILLSDYKRVLEENEEINKKYDKDTHILQNELDYANADRIDLVQQNKELRKENEELKNQEETVRKVNELLVERYSTSIPVQKVKDKIEEYKEKIVEARNEDDDCKEIYYEQEINVLQELLEKR